MEKEQEYKCTRCHCYKIRKYYGEYNDQRNKVCKKCAKEDKKWDNVKKKYKYDKNIEWKCHPIYEGYMCDENGYVVDMKTKKLIGEIDQAGYIRLKLNVPEEKIISGHRFVCETWIRTIPKKHVVNHINEKKTDNSVKNLEIITQSENMKKATKKPRGPRDGKKCIARKENCKEEIEYKSMYRAAKETGCEQGLVQRMCNGLREEPIKSKINDDMWIFRYV